MGVESQTTLAPHPSPPPRGGTEELLRQYTRVVIE